MKHWYCIQSKPREDARAEEHLRNQGYEVFRPMLRARKRRAAGMATVTESLFPRYLFIRLDDRHENWMPLRSTRGVAGLVKFGQRPIPVPDEIIRDVECRLDTETGCLDLSKANDFRPNDPVTITEGPFQGLEAVFQARKGEDRVILLLNIMQQSQRVTVPEYAIAR